MSVASDWASLMVQNLDSRSVIDAQRPLPLTTGNCVFSVTDEGGLSISTGASLKLDETLTLADWLEATYR